jgi:type VI secretion system protein ImpH
MGASSRRPDPSVIETLESEPQRFGFFQAVRLLLHAAHSGETARAGAASGEIGTTTPPQAERLKFSSTLSLAFPGAQLASVERQETDNGRGVHQVRIAFFGLAGAAGVLPSHYTRLAIDRVRRGDEALRDFLDQFNHRGASFFYRAWEKHRLAVGYERAAARRSSREDLLTQCLYALVGYGSNALSATERQSSVLRERLSFSDETLLYYAGHLTHRPRSQRVLENVLNEYTGSLIRVLQFRGQWLHLSISDQSRTASRLAPRGVNCELGINAMIGGRIWTGESRFRLRLGPLPLHEFQEYMPGRKRLREISELTAAFTGTEFDFDIQPILRAADIPSASLSGSAQLGWSAWVLSKPRQRDGDEAVFQPEGAFVPPARAAG